MRPSRPAPRRARLRPAPPDVPRTSPPTAPRDTSRERASGSSGSSRRAASSSSGGASLPCVETNAICARSRSTRARSSSSSAPALRRREQTERVVERAGLELRLRRGQRALRAARGIGCQRGGALEEGGGGGEAAARLRPRRGALELRGDLLVGHGRRLRAVPRAAIRVDLADRLPPPARGGPRAARSARPLRTPPSERADDGTPPHRPSVSKPSDSDGVRGRLRDPELLRRPPDSAGSPTGSAAARSSNRRASRGSRASRRVKLSSIPADSGSAAGRPKPPASWAGRQPARQLQQRERIPARLGDDPLQHGLVQPRRQDGLQQRPRIATAQRLDVELREAGERVAQLARREHERDPLRQQAASHERERARRRTVEPLRVVDDAQERLLLGGLGQQAEDRQPDEERIRRRSGAEPERDAERVALGLREALDELEDRRAQLLQRRVRRAPSPPSTPDGPGDAKLPRPPRPRTRAARSCRRPALRAPPGRRRGRRARPSSSRSSTSRSRCRPSSCAPGLRPPTTIVARACHWGHGLRISGIRSPARAATMTHAIDRHGRSTGHDGTPDDAEHRLSARRRPCPTTRRSRARRSAPPSTSRATTSAASSGTSTGSPTAPTSRRS